MVRFNYRTILIWNLFFIAISTHTILENSDIGLIIFIIITFIYPDKISTFKRITLFSIAFSSYFFGPVSLFLTTFLIFLFTNQVKLGTKFLLAMTSVYIFIFYFDTIPTFSFYNISIASLFFLFSPILITCLLLIKEIWFKSFFIVFFQL